MKKESHLCNPKQGEHKPESARLEGIENEQKGQAKRKIKFSKKTCRKKKDFYLCTPETKEGKLKAQGLKQKK